MHKRPFGRTGWQVSEIGFGGWAIGGEWGSVSDQDAEAALHAALDHGVSFLDTADVYGNGRSERLIARVLKARGKGDVTVATKAGRKIQPHVSAGYTPAVLEKFIDDSLRNLELQALDVVQLHCPPFEVYYRPEIFEALDRQVAAGKIRAYGVSVEKVEQAIKALDYPIASARQSCCSISPGEETSPSSHACRSPAGCSRESCAPTASSARTTIARSTVTAKHSMWARPSPAYPSTWDCKPSKRCARWRRRVRRWRNSPCAGSSCSTRSLQ